MKPAVTVIRILTGLLFIFSGLVKAIDPLGLAYKMQEFFEVWAQSDMLRPLMNSLDKYVVSFSIIMITLEVAVGIAIILGWQKKAYNLDFIITDVVLYFSHKLCFVYR